MTVRATSRRSGPPPIDLIDPSQLLRRRRSGRRRAPGDCASADDLGATDDPAAELRSTSRVLLLVGEQGMGKTRIVHELRATLGPVGVMLSECDESERYSARIYDTGIYLLSYILSDDR